MPKGEVAGPPARERLLTAADELFYREGVQTVGIDRIISRAGVAKASLYSNFGSKEELVRAYLESRHARTTERTSRALTQFRTPRERLLGVFDAPIPRSTGAPRVARSGIGEFVMASAEARSSPPFPLALGRKRFELSRV
jgi:AcrR family transcriptional regulator